MRSIAVKCDADSAARLNTIAKLWPRVIGSQQSNILDDAFIAYVELDPSHHPAHKVRFDGNAMGPFDTARFEQLCKLWPGIDRNAQKALVERVQFVTGSTSAA